MILKTQSIQGLNTQGDYCGLGHEKGLVISTADVERRALRPRGIYHWLLSHASIYIITVVLEQYILSNHHHWLVNLLF